MPDQNNGNPEQGPKGAQTPPARPEEVIRDALSKIARVIGDATGMTVQTKLRPFNVADRINFEGEGEVVAETRIEVDGDRTLLVPIQVLPSGTLTIPQEIYEIHERHVAEAQAYRQELLKLLVDYLPKLR